MNWKSIRMELGSTGEFPGGSVSRAYLVRLPLDDHDLIDESALRLNPTRAIVRRHWATEPDQKGLVTGLDGRWSMRCDGEERLLQLQSGALRLGAHASVVEPNGDVLPFRIVSVR